MEWMAPSSLDHCLRPFELSGMTLTSCAEKFKLEESSGPGQHAIAALVLRDWRGLELASVEGRWTDYDECAKAWKAKTAPPRPRVLAKPSQGKCECEQSK